MSEMKRISYADGAEDTALYVLSPRGKKGETVSHSGKSFILDGDIIKTETRHFTFYTPAEAAYDIGDTQSLARALRGIINGDFGPSFIVRGRPTNPRSVTRRKMGRNEGKNLPSIAEHPSRHIVLDLDGLPNPEGFDPRDGWIADASDWAISLLPEPMRRAAWVVVASSSCCLRDDDKRPLARGTAPSQLRLHLHGHVTEDIGEVELRGFLKAVDGHIRSELVSRYSIQTVRVLDAATATSNQPIFLSVAFGDGLSDPFETSPRMWVREGEHIDVGATLEACLPPPPSAPTAPRTPRPRKELTQSENAEYRAYIANLEADAATAERENQAQRITAAPASKGKSAAFREWSITILEDLQTIMQARIDSGLWPNGMPEGAGRSLLLLKIASLTQFARYSKTNARRFVLDFAADYLEGGEAFAQEWLASNPLAFSPAARPGKSAFLSDLNISKEEIQSLGLRAFRDAKDHVRRMRHKRVEDGLNARGKPRQRSITGDTLALEAEHLGISRRTLARRKAAEKAALKQASTEVAVPQVSSSQQDEVEVPVTVRKVAKYF